MTDPAAPLPTRELIWLVEATYAPDAAETRTAVRAAHLARVVELKRSGVFVEAGGFRDVSSSILMVRAASEAAALDIVRADVYIASGVWVELRARAFDRVVLETDG